LEHTKGFLVTRNSRAFAKKSKTKTQEQTELGEMIGINNRPLKNRKKYSHVANDKVEKLLSDSERI
jgi:hypothetical protein